MATINICSLRPIKVQIANANILLDRLVIGSIPEDEIERLKREVSVQRLADARGIELRRHGADLIGQCPFHEDHAPSLVITPAKNLIGGTAWAPAGPADP